MSWFKDLGIHVAKDRFALSAADSELISKAPTRNTQVATTSQANSDDLCKIIAKHRIRGGEYDTKTGVSGSAEHKAVATDWPELSSTQKRKNVKAIAEAEGVSVMEMKKKLKAERTAKALAEQKEKERQDRKLKNKQAKKDNLRAAAEAEEMSITAYKKQLNGEKAARALANQEAIKCKEAAGV